METHFLNIDVPESQLTECIFRIEDHSVYSTLLPYNNPQLVIELPGGIACVTFGAATVPAITQGFALNLNACMFGIQTENCGLKQYPLPDGIYKIEYSVSPNNLLVDQKNILRTVSARLRLRKLYAKLDIGSCEPTGETQKRFDTLEKIDRWLRVAEILVRDKNDCHRGMQLYTYALSLMSKVDCKHC
jgi:hypothetical protein